MNHFDDDLITGLTSALAERQSEISLPDGIGADARRAARRRTASRAVAGGVPVLAAAGVATALAVGANSGARADHGTSAVRGLRIDSPSATAPRVEDTAYIVRRVKAAVAADSENSTVTDSVEYLHGQVSADGSLAGLGRLVGDQWTYTRADGTVAQRQTLFNPDGSDYLVQDSVFTPTANGTYDEALTTINPLNHSYYQGEFSGFANPDASSNPGLGSTPTEVQQAVTAGQVTVKGQTTVNGTPAIALTVSTASGSSPGTILYVDAQSYEPLGTVMTLPRTDSLFTTEWVPSTPQNIAKAQDASIPSGYTRTDNPNDWGNGTATGAGNSGNSGS